MKNAGVMGTETLPTSYVWKKKNVFLEDIVTK